MALRYWCCVCWAVGVVAMSDYTPDTETVREQYTREQPPHIGTVGEKGREFDRWLAGVKAEALREAAEGMRRAKEPYHWNLSVGPESAASPDMWLLYRADKIEKDGL